MEITIVHLSGTPLVETVIHLTGETIMWAVVHVLALAAAGLAVFAALTASSEKEVW